MRLKERRKSNFWGNLKAISKQFYTKIFTKKTKIVFWAVVLFFIFLIGHLSGLFIYGNFAAGSLQKVFVWIDKQGLATPLLEFKRNIMEIKEENIKIPFNYIKGQLSNPPKIYIDLSFEDYKRLEYQRNQAIGSLTYTSLFFQRPEGLLLKSEDDYVPATLKYGNKEMKIKLRLKGDMTDHLEGDKWSFRIKIKGQDTLFGMKTFSIQDPDTRVNLNQYIYHQALKREGVMGLRYDFIEVVINGENKGIYAIEEHFEKELIEDNNRREGVIIKFNEVFSKEAINDADKINNQFDFTDYADKNIKDWYYNSRIESFENENIMTDPILSKQLKEGVYLLELFRSGKLKTSEVFDIEKLAKYFAVNTVLGETHSFTWENIRFYYNPVTSLLEPIGYDSINGRSADYTMDLLFPDCLDFRGDCSQNRGTFEHSIFRDPIFFKKYIQELERISQQSYLDSLFSALDKDLKNKLDVLHKDYPSYHFSTEPFYENQQLITKRLNPVREINVYFQNSLLSQNMIVLAVGNTISLPLEVVNLAYNDSNNDLIIFDLEGKNKILQPKLSSGECMDKIGCGSVEYQEFVFKIPTNFEWNDSYISNLKLNYKVFGTENINTKAVLPWAYVNEDVFLENSFIRQQSDLSSFSMLQVDESANSIFIKKGRWTLDKSLIIPPGFSVFSEGGVIINLIESAAILSYSDLQLIGTEKDPILITSSDKTGQGLAVLNADKLSNIKHVTFSYLTTPTKENWELTGAITFYESPVIFENVLITGMSSEDGLNIIRSEFKIKNSKIENSFSDCLDIDFGKGLVENSYVTNCGNDALDFSGSVVQVENNHLTNLGDKGISFGEKSKGIIKNNYINNSFIGVASKDESVVYIENSNISNTKYGLALYQKKPEFGSSSLIGSNVIILNSDRDYIIEDKSSLSINGVDVANKNKDKKVYEILYGLQ